MSQSPPVIIPTCDSYLWAVRIFAYLFNIYWSSLQKVYIFGYAQPTFNLPRNFTFISLDDHNYPADKWSDGLIKGLGQITDEHVVIMLEDYWLNRMVDCRGVMACYDFMQYDNTILRCDLTTDRLYSGRMIDYTAFGTYDIIITPYDAPYQISLQAGLWNRRNLLKILKPDVSPWNFELQTKCPPDMKVIGTRQYPVRYINAFKGGDTSKVLNLDQLAEEHANLIRSKGWLP